MIDRRELLKWSIVAPALVGAPYAAFARSPRAIDALVLDRRYVPDDFADGDAPKLYRFDGDVTSLWYETLDPIWRRPGFVLGGITGSDALFVLETLAADRGRRVVSRRRLSEGVKPQPGRDAGIYPVNWVIAPVHPSVKG